MGGAKEVKRWALRALVAVMILSTFASPLISGAKGATTPPTNEPRPIVGFPPAGRGFVRDHVTAIGDSVMVDYSDELERFVPGIAVHAAVGLQFLSGLVELEQLRSENQLGASVVVALGTNGPVSQDLMDQLLSTLSGASRIVLVTDFVDRPWQNENNRLIFEIATSHPHIVIANWASRAKRHPDWLYADGTHLLIDGPGAHELGWIIRQALHRR